MIGTRAMSGSAASRLRNVLMACTESSRPSSMFTSRICAPPSTCCRATSSASAYCPARTSFANLGEPVTFVRSPTLTKLESGRITNGSRPERRVRCSDLRPPARRQAAHGLGDPPDVGRRRAAAAAHQVEEARAGPLAEAQRHGVGRLVEAAEGVGQARVRVRAHEARRETRQLLDVRPHLLGAERAVDADREERRVRDRDPEGLDRLAREVPTRQVGDRDRGHHRTAEAAHLEGALDREESGLRVESVEGGLHEQQVGPAVEEAQGLLVVDLLELGERHPARPGVVHVAGQRGRPVGRPERARHPGHAPVLLRHDPVDRPASRARRRDVDVVGQRLGAVVGLRDPRAVERVRLDDVGPGRQVLAVGGGRRRRGGSG